MPPVVPPVDQAQYEEIYKHYARLDVPVLEVPEAADIVPSGRFGAIGYAKQMPTLQEAAVWVAEDQAYRVRFAESHRERDKTLYWVQRWPLRIERVPSEFGAWRVSMCGLALWLTPSEADAFRHGVFPWKVLGNQNASAKRFGTGSGDFGGQIVIAADNDGTVSKT